jgi:hypothetical protein
MSHVVALLVEALRYKPEGSITGGVIGILMYDRSTWLKTLPLSCADIV